MTEERRRILQMVADGKITVDDAERLLQAIGENASEEGAPAPEGRDKPRPRWLLIQVKKQAWSDAAVDEARKAWGWPGFSGAGREKEVNLRVPMALVRGGLRLGAMLPGLDATGARLRERGIDVDLTRIDPAMIESMLAEMGEMNIDIDSGRAQVRIRCE